MLELIVKISSTKENHFSVQENFPEQVDHVKGFSQAATPVILTCATSFKYSMASRHILKVLTLQDADQSSHLAEPIYILMLVRMTEIHLCSP